MKTKTWSRQNLDPGARQNPNGRASKEGSCTSLVTTFCTFVFLTLTTETPAHYNLCCIKISVICFASRVWEPEMRKKTGVQRGWYSKPIRWKQGWLKPLTQSQSLYMGGKFMCQRCKWTKNRARQVFSRREKAQIPTCLFLPQRGKRYLGNKRFKLIPTIVSASETFFKHQADIMQRKLYSYKYILTTQDSSIGQGRWVGVFK